MSDTQTNDGVVAADEVVVEAPVVAPADASEVAVEVAPEEVTAAPEEVVAETAPEVTA
jgi:hypothetical protein